MSNKDRYRELCHQEESIPLFSRDWWLDTVCGPNNWDVLLLEKDDRVVASMPIHFSDSKKKQIVMPRLTQTMGPWIKYPAGQKSHSKLSFEKDCHTYLIESLPSFDIFAQNFHYSVSNWLPYYWKKFSQTTKYTYILDDLSDPDKLFNEFRSNIRTDIKKAGKLVDVSCPDDIQEFYRVNSLSFTRQRLKMPYSLSFVEELQTSCKQRDCCQMFFAKDKANGRTHAAIFLVWDSNSAYYLMGGADPDLRNSGATSLLLWEAIRFASTVTNRFDFEGSMLEPVERFFRSFGAVQQPYHHISKTNSLRMKIGQFRRSL